MIAAGTGVNPQMLLINGYNKINSVLLLTIPLFVLAGSLMNNGGLGEKLVDSVSKSKLGKSKSSLGVVTVLPAPYLAQSPAPPPLPCPALAPSWRPGCGRTDTRMA